MGRNLKLNIMLNNFIKYMILFFLLLSYSNCIVNKSHGYSTSQDSLLIDLEVDKLGNYYTFDNFGEVKMYISNELTYSFSNSNYGTLAMIDVSNPHKILLFYREQQIIILLDNSLSKIGEINLDNNSYFTALGMSNDGNIWLYDSFLLRLKKIDKAGNSIDESFPANNIIPENIIDSKIIERENYVMVLDKKEGILLYNNMGVYERTLPILDIDKPTIIDGKVYYFNKRTNIYQDYDLRFNSITNHYNLSDLSIKPDRLIFADNMFYILENGKLDIINVK